MTHLTYPCAINNAFVDRIHDELYSGAPEVATDSAVADVCDALKQHTDNAYGLQAPEVRQALIRALMQSDEAQVDHMLITLLEYQGVDPWMVHASSVMRECARMLANDEVDL